MGATLHRNRFSALRRIHPPVEGPSFDLVTTQELMPFVCALLHNRELRSLSAVSKPVAVALSGSLFVLGGWQHGELLTSFERFDPCSGQWQALAALPRPLSSMKMIAAAGRLYVLGVDETLDYLYMSKMQQFDPDTLQWRSINKGPGVFDYNIDKGFDT